MKKLFMALKDMRSEYRRIGKNLHLAYAMVQYSIDTKIDAHDLSKKLRISEDDVVEMHRIGTYVSDPDSNEMMGYTYDQLKALYDMGYLAEVMSLDARGTIAPDMAVWEISEALMTYKKEKEMSSMIVSIFGSMKEYYDYIAYCANREWDNDKNIKYASKIGMADAYHECPDEKVEDFMQGVFLTIDRMISERDFNVRRARSIEIFADIEEVEKYLEYYRGDMWDDGMNGWCASLVGMEDEYVNSASYEHVMEQIFSRINEYLLGGYVV